jgi:hypothetical protein
MRERKEMPVRLFRFGALTASAALLAAAGCTSVTPQAPAVGAGTIEANTARRGTPEFCRRYADQTFANTYQSNNDTSGPDAAGQQAASSGDAAYRRCLAGRTN